MPGTGTFPDVSVASPDFLELSASWIDAKGNTKAIQSKIDETATDAEVQALLVASQAQSNASLFRVKLTRSWEGAELASNALTQAYITLADMIRYSYGTALGANLRWYVPAILSGQILPGDIPDVDAALWDAVNNAYAAVVPGGYSYMNTGFVESASRNQSVKAS